ncbi:FadR/GntR family transcriptional regulator [Brevibacterium aurantiacum]|uniref:FadR family transcriptional regulator n=1 Tax=Brevibacterium aurantiacum TaxID=273384 RepID=A0A556CMC4_BREAU|nr:FCD domain-containing protein [Brevibacterium aurantiacum]TSI18593.1 FadR family transcriptional regulator [Brevibacterium aurantiacum]
MASIGHTGTSAVMQAVMKSIRVGELDQGEKLESERTLASRFGISRTTVREGLKELEVRGFVRRVQGSGTFVSFDRDNEHKKSMLGTGTETERQFREVMDLRQSLEPAIAFRAAKRSSAETDSLDEIIARAESLDPSHLEELAALDTEFHIAIAALTLNPLLVDLLTETHEVFGFTRRSEFQSASRIRTSLSGHRAIADAISRGDGPAARSCMEEHLYDVSQSIVF